ncbi:hypothetical protein MNBD_GAMMA09-2066 [hydrothermal vent metagenome]|uniref:Antitoxin Xre/MbcA/ParS-like toxin-binding domain-containing protein n=1 Tax=hydrothermal vent metagenome TaxID=652676 RepID=A0A3B0XM56_9ZZZZ
MHLIRLQDVNQSEKKLTLAVLQITQMLGIYHAELARILHLQCADIGELSNSRQNIEAGTDAWRSGVEYIELYEALYRRYDGNEIQIHHWLRKKSKGMPLAPLYMMVDELEITTVLELLKGYPD